MSKYDGLLQTRKKTTAEPPNRVGRPRGKASDPEYRQITAYIRRATWVAAKKKLLDETETDDFSELIEDLVSKWAGTAPRKDAR